jgi:lysophospholipase L1-like esterase
MSSLCWCALFAGILISTVGAQEKHLPRVVLVGDSIRIGYAPFVAKLLDGRAIVVSPKPNGEDSGNVLNNLDEWVINENPDVVHINTGLHDLKLKDKNYQVPLASYENNLKTIVERIKKETNAKVVFATTTPIIDSRHAQRRAGFDRFEADVQKYNAAAVSVMKHAGVAINDLHKLIEDGGKERLLGGDGTHYTQEGYEMLASAVTDSIVRSLGLLDVSR